MEHDFLGGAQVPAFSFRYGGRPSSEFLADWPREEDGDGGVTRTTWSEPAGPLRVTLEVRRPAGFAAVDWVVRFANAGAAATAVLEDVLPLDLTVAVGPRERLAVHTAQGSRCQADDFLPLCLDLPPGRRHELAPRGGRSSNGAFPFFDLQRPGGGMVLAVGWSGQWAAAFDRSQESLHITAGMQRTHLRLQPGEHIRTPRILTLTWEGDREDTGTNGLRRLLLAHYVPRVGGEPVAAPIAQCLQAYYYLTGQAGARYEQAALPRAAEAGAEVYWIDACWYGHGREWWREVGSWTVNRDRFPDGLRPISDAARRAGMKFVLWFEPERVRADSDLAAEHPEFLLRSPDAPDNLLLNLGDPRALRYLAGRLSDAIAEHGLDIYRQDFNFDPLPYWQAADAPDRVGMTEIRYVEGLYALWDELRERHPGLWIDNCASGGRRIDLESLSRAVPLWPSDFNDVCGLATGQLHVGDQVIHAGLARWAPAFGGGTWSFEPYAFRSSICGGTTFGFDIDPSALAGARDELLGQNDVLGRGKTLLDDDFPMDRVRAAIAERKSLRPFFTGDVHVLVPLSTASHDWCACQFHRADLEAGYAVFLRRPDSPFPRMLARLRDIDEAAEYLVSLSPDYAEAPRRRMSGRELAATTIEIERAPGSLLLRYAREK